MNPPPHPTTSNDAPAPSNPTPWDSRWLTIRVSISEVEIERSPFNTSGGFGDVFRGRHPVYGLLALKRLRGGPGVDNTGRIRKFQSEVETWKTLVHSHVLPFFGTDQLDGHVYLISPFAEHGTVLDYLKQNPLSDRSKFLREIASAMGFLHSKSIIHGDLKGRNVLVCPNLSAQVCDFGLARYADSSTATSLKGAMTVRWSSPEIMRGTSKSYASDIYAFGMTIVEILSGDSPFSEYSTDVAVMQVVLFENKRPSRTPPKSPDGTSYDKEWEVAELCWIEEAGNRPRMDEVILKLAPAQSVSGSVDQRRPTKPATTFQSPTLAKEVTQTMDLQQSSPEGEPHTLRLSDEVLLRILTSCWNDLKGESGVHFPTIASHVCRMWRRCVIAAPKFWTVLKFELSAAPTDKHAVWLERSKDYPLHIIIKSKAFTLSSFTEARRVIELVVPHIRRWRSLDVDLRGLLEDIPHLIFDRIAQEGSAMLQSLELMKVRGNGEYLGWSDGMEVSRMKKRSVQPLSTGELPPKLRHIILDGVSHEYYVDRFRNLQVLEIAGSSTSVAEVIRDILSKLPELRTLHFPGFHYRNMAARDSTTSLLTHHSLTELSIETTGDTTDDVMSSLVLPKLRLLLHQARAEATLGLRCLPHLARNHPFPEFVSLRFGADSRGPLRLGQHIKLDATNMDDLAAALRGFGQLRMLTFGRVDFEGGRHLYDLGSTCPRLRWLELDRCYGFTLRSLLTIVEQRRSRAEELDSLVRIVVLDGRPPEGTPGELEALARLAGFKHLYVDSFGFTRSPDFGELERERWNIIGL